jgi:hypothetical protein
VPIVVVFTKFDYLVELACQDLPDDASDETIEELCAEKAEMEFQKLCVKPLRRVNPELPYARSSGVMRFSYRQCSID